MTKSWMWLSAAALGAACQVTESRVEDRPSDRFVRVGEFRGHVDAKRGTITFERGATGRGLQVLDYDRDGVAGAGDADTVELVTTAVGDDFCGANSYGGNVTLNHFYAGTVTNLIAQIRQVTPPTGHDPLNSDGDTLGLDGDLGLWTYASSGSSRTWCFNATGGGDFDFSGLVWGDIAPDNSQDFFATGTIQSYTVPIGVTSITIEAFGAQGGSSNGGRGARMAGTFAVTPGEQLGVVVGSQGTTNSCGGAPASGAGGGGSFVWRLADPSLPLIAAGGGGGGNLNWSGSCIIGIDAVTTPNGTQGSGVLSALGGVAGQGGAGNAPSGTGAGGGGWLSSGQNSTFDNSPGGQGFPSFLGGAGSITFAPGGVGGFGGGGSPVCGCGGGGGFSGGGGGEGSSCRAGGGGGGSFNSGTSQSNTAGVQTGDGFVTISF